MIPGNHDVLELGPELVGAMFGTEQKRPAGFEQQRLHDGLRSTVMRFHGNQREVAEAGVLGQDRSDLIRRHLPRPALGADVGAASRIGEGIQQLLHVARLEAGLRKFAIVRQHHLRSLENIFLERERGDPGAEIGGDRNAFLDRNQRWPARLADKGQKHILDGHRNSPEPP
nr:hypothetical protein [Bradyrhizobium yuanmingense]